MRRSLIIIGVFFALISSPAPADAAGCIKGAIAGGVAGHYAGRHTYVGALGGCLVGRRLAAQNAARARERAAAQNRAIDTDRLAQRLPPKSTYTGAAYTRGTPGNPGAVVTPGPQSSPSPTTGYTGGAYQR